MKPKVFDADLNIKIKLSQREKLKAEAEKRGLSLADLVRVIFTQWIEDGCKLK